MDQFFNEFFEKFKEISNIPRQSGHEEKIADFLEEFSKKIICITTEIKTIMF